MKLLLVRLREDPSLPQNHIYQHECTSYVIDLFPLTTDLLGNEPEYDPFFSSPADSSFDFEWDSFLAPEFTSNLATPALAASDGCADVNLQNFVSEESSPPQTLSPSSVFNISSLSVKPLSIDGGKSSPEALIGNASTEGQPILELSVPETHTTCPNLPNFSCYSCPHCPYPRTFSRPGDLRKHVKQSHTPVPCPSSSCHKSFANDVVARRHFNSAHHAESSAQSLHCHVNGCKQAFGGGGNGFRRRDLLNRHLRGVHRLTPTTTNGSKKESMTNQVCGKRSASRLALDWGLTVGAKSNSLADPNCNGTFHVLANNRPPSNRFERCWATRSLPGF